MKIAALCMYFPCQLLYFHWSSFTVSQINIGLTQIFNEAQWGTVVASSAVCLCASGSAGRYKRGNTAQGLGCCVHEGSGSLVADLQAASLLLFFFFFSSLGFCLYRKSYSFHCCTLCFWEQTGPLKSWKAKPPLNMEGAPFAVPFFPLPARGLKLRWLLPENFAAQCSVGGRGACSHGRTKQYPKGAVPTQTLTPKPFQPGPDLSCGPSGLCHTTLAAPRWADKIFRWLFSWGISPGWRAAPCPRWSQRGPTPGRLTAPRSRCCIVRRQLSASPRGEQGSLMQAFCSFH